MDPSEYWSGLLAFVRTASAGSFTAAGRQLGMSPSAVGRAVSRLEGRLGATLIKRSTRVLALTPEGQAFLEQVSPALDALREAEGAVGSARVATGTVRISASIDLGRMLVASWTQTLADQYPELTLELNVTDKLVDLRREGIDIAIRLGSLPPLGVVGETVGTAGYAVVCAPEYVARHGSPKTPAELSSHACLQYLTVAGVPFKWTFEGREMTTAGQFVTDDGGALLTAALAGAGIAYMLRFAVLSALADSRLVELLPNVPKAKLPISLAHPFGARPPGRVQVVLTFLQAQLAVSVCPRSSLCLA